MLFSDFAVVFRTLLLFSLDAAVVFSGHCCCFLRMLLPFPSVSAVFVSCFCTKTFRNLYKTEYFLYKKRRKFQHVFSVFSGYILSGPRTFLLFSLTIANRKSCFWRSDRPQMAGFILVSRMFFMPFPDRLDRFFGFFLLLFLHFSVVCRQKKLCCSFIRIIRFRDFFASSGYFFVQCWEIFSSHSRFFSAFPEFFSKEKPVFSASASRFRAFFPHLSNHFQAFFVQCGKFFSPYP